MILADIPNGESDADGIGNSPSDKPSKESAKRGRPAEPLDKQRAPDALAIDERWANGALQPRPPSRP
jgi:hypothetical protein